MLMHRAEIVALQDIAYEGPVAQRDLWRRGGIPARVLGTLATHGYITRHPIDGYGYVITEAGRAALDALRRAHPAASPFVFYRRELP